MERRAFERIDTNLKAVIFLGDNICHGTISNISEKGMYINANISLPLQLKCEVLLHSGGDILKLPVNIRRVAKSKGLYKGIGVELLNSPDSYLDLVNTLKSDSYMIGSF